MSIRSTTDRINPLNSAVHCCLNVIAISFPLNCYVPDPYSYLFFVVIKVTMTMQTTTMGIMFMTTGQPYSRKPPLWSRHRLSACATSK